MSDETGSAAGAKLVWSDRAWEKFLGRPTEELVEEEAQFLGEMESRMTYTRVTFLMGWSPEVGKLAVCDIHGTLLGR